MKEYERAEVEIILFEDDLILTDDGWEPLSVEQNSWNPGATHEA